MGTSFEDGPEVETRRGKQLVDIAQKEKIEHLVYSSVANADKNTGIPHFESKYKIEQHIKSAKTSSISPETTTKNGTALSPCSTSTSPGCIADMSLYCNTTNLLWY